MRIYGLLLILLILPVAYSDLSARDIAADNLRELYREDGIYAGTNQFSDYWARDAFFASLGANSIGDFSISKKNLELFLSYQKKDGQVPLRVGHYDITLKLLGITLPQKQRARYDQDKLFTTPRDQNCLFVIAAEDYITKSRDVEFAQDNFDNFEKAIIWLASKDTNGNLLVEEGNYANWADSVKKDGEVLYTNVCYYKALDSLSKIATVAGDSDKATLYSLWAQLIKEQINKRFWFGNYYVDWIAKDVKYTYFSADGNILSIIWGVADDETAKSILKYIESDNLSAGFGVQTSDGYDVRRISVINLLSGTSDYHSDMRWLWLSCLYAKALDDNGFKQQSLSELAEIKTAIKEYGVVHEVYEPDGTPVDRWFYKSEKPLAWSAGVCTWVFEELDI